MQPLAIKGESEWRGMWWRHMENGTVNEIQE